MEILKYMEQAGIRDQSRIDGVKPANVRRSESSSDRDKDKVSVSGEGKLFSSALKEASNASEIRHEKVNRIKAMIESGEYMPDSRKIAQGLIREETELWS